MFYLRKEYIRIFFSFLCLHKRESMAVTRPESMVGPKTYAENKHTKIHRIKKEETNERKKAKKKKKLLYT